MLCRKIRAIASIALTVVIVCPLAAARELPRADEPATTRHECIDACEAPHAKVIEKCERWNDAHPRLPCYHGAAKGNDHTEGQALVPGQGGDVGSGVGAGGSFGVAVGAGVGGRGDYDGPQGEPSGEESPPACNDSDLPEAEDSKPSDPDAPQAGAFAPSLFKFKTTVPDDGSDKGGGEQQASTVLTFMDWRGLLPKFWTCDMKVRMPLRTELLGTISAKKAAQITAKVANQASSEVMHSRSEWPVTELFCIRFRDRMNEIFKKDYKGLGGRVAA